MDFWRLLKRGQSSLLTVGEHEWGAAAGSGGGHRCFAGEGLKHLQYLLVKRFMSPLQGFLRSCPVYPGRCPGLSHWRTVGACKMGSVLTIDSWRAWQSRKPPVSRCWRKKGSVLTIDSWEAWRGERQQVRAGGTVGVGERCGFGAFDGRIPEGTFTARARPLRILPTPGGSP